MSSTAILTEMKSDSLQYLAVLSLNRISISEFIQQQIPKFQGKNSYSLQIVIICRK